MKKVLMVLCAVMLVFGVVGTASATTFVEEYNGYQSVNEGDTYNFGFDFWYQNSVHGVGTNSSLSLIQDAAGAQHDPWDSASLYIDFYSVDPASEKAGIQLTAWDSSGNTGESFDLGTVDFNGTWWNVSVYNYVYDFTAEQLAAFESWGWGNVAISATATPWWNYNDFAITTVGMEVNTAPVPEPSTVLLLGMGLLGLAGCSRKSFRKKA